MIDAKEALAAFPQFCKNLDLFFGAHKIGIRGRGGAGYGNHPFKHPGPTNEHPAAFVGKLALSMVNHGLDEMGSQRYCLVVHIDTRQNN